MLSLAGPLLLMSWWVTGQLSRHNGLYGFTVAKTPSVIPEPIRLTRRNSRRPLHFIVELGTPATPVGIRPLSYSAETWILSSSDPYCQDEVCNHGIFSPQQSSTYTAAAPPQANVSIPAIDLLYGGHGFRDTIMLGGITAENVSMKLALESTRAVSVLGLGHQESSMGNPQEGVSFLEGLVGKGLISAAAYSVWLGGPDDADDLGNMLLGAVDHSKYAGTLWTLQTHHVVASGWGGRYIALSGLNASSATGSDVLMPSDTVVPVQVIFGEWTNVLPSYLASRMWQAVGAHYSVDAGATLIPCGKNTSAGQFLFQLGGPQGPVLKVGMQHLVVPSSQSSVDSAYPTDNNGLCEFNLGSSPEPADWRLGDNFLRAMYVVFDPERSTVAVAPLVRDGDAENIEALGALDERASGATPVPGQPSSLAVPSFPSAPGPTTLVSAEGFQRSLDGQGSDGAASGGGLSVGAKAAIGVGVSLGTLLVVALLLRRGTLRSFQQTRSTIHALRKPSRRPHVYELQDHNRAHHLEPTHELGNDDKAPERGELPG